MLGQNLRSPKMGFLVPICYGHMVQSMGVSAFSAIRVPRVPGGPDCPSTNFLCSANWRFGTSGPRFPLPSPDLLSSLRPIGQSRTCVLCPFVTVKPGKIFSFFQPRSGISLLSPRVCGQMSLCFTGHLEAFRPI
ncbi:hypothetical protein KI387_019080, partial [Taxus chinensis]